MLKRTMRSTTILALARVSVRVTAANDGVHAYGKRECSISTVKRRRHMRRRHMLAAMGMLVLAGGAVLGWHVLATGGRPDAIATDTPHHGGHSLLATTTSTRLSATTTTTTDPGLLPQTTAFPFTQTPQFENEMSDLFQAIVTDSAALAQPAYFPESAYLQLKTIYNARSDYVTRLEGDFSLDIGAAHVVLGNDAGAAKLLEATAPSGFGHWVPPGVCDNSVGYYELPNARMVYQEDGQIRSFGIASMISWRGVWYVVHLGAILRSTDDGLVDDPSVGPGASIPSSTC